MLAKWCIDTKQVTIIFLKTFYNASEIKMSLTSFSVMSLTSSLTVIYDPNIWYYFRFCKCSQSREILEKHANMYTYNHGLSPFSIH